VSTSVLPAFIDALMAAATTALPDVTVADCWPVSLNSGDWLLIGVDDAEASRTIGASGTQVYPHAQRLTRDESAEVHAVIWCAHDDDDVKGARDAAFAILAAVEALLRASITLDVASVWKASMAAWSYTPHRLADYGSTVAEIQFSITYEARI